MAITKAAFTEDCGLFATPQGSTSPPSVERPATVVREGQVTPATLSATWSGAFSMAGVSKSGIDYFVMAITSAEGIVPQPAAAEMDEHGEQTVMAKKKRHSRAEIATKLAQANEFSDARETAKRNCAHAWCECDDLAPMAQSVAWASGCTRGR